MWNNVLNFKDCDLYINCMPLNHVGGLSIFFRSIYFKMQMKIVNYKTALLIKYQQPFYISLVPTMLYDLMHMRKCIYKNLKASIIGGDHLEEDLLNSALDSNIPIYISGLDSNHTYTNNMINVYFTSSDLLEIGKKCFKIQATNDLNTIHPIYIDYINVNGFH